MKPKKPSSQQKKPAGKLRRAIGIRQYLLIILILILVLPFGIIVLFGFVNPPATYQMFRETLRGETIHQEFMKIENIPINVTHSIVAAEDARFCQHWGFDLRAIRAEKSIDNTMQAGTISQQIARLVFLWGNGRSTLKILETPITYAIELFWSKQRILEIYLNYARYDQSVYGVAAASRYYLGKSIMQLTEHEAALLAIALAKKFTGDIKSFANDNEKQVRSIIDGAKYIGMNTLSECFSNSGTP